MSETLVFRTFVGALVHTLFSFLFSPLTSSSRPQTLEGLFGLRQRSSRAFNFTALSLITLLDTVKTTDTHLDCVFVENTLVFIDPKICGP